MLESSSSSSLKRERERPIFSRGKALPYCPDFLYHRPCPALTDASFDCGYEHTPKEKRITCPDWFEKNCCKYGEDCFLPHVHPNPVPLVDVSLIIQTPENYVSRCVDFFNNEDDDFVVIGTGKQHGGTKKFPTAVFLKSRNGTGYSSVARVMSKYSEVFYLSRPLSRYYCVSETHTSLESAMTALHSRLNQYAHTDPSAPIRFRSQCLPNSMEETVVRSVERLNSMSPTPLPLTAALKDWEVMLSCVLVDGCYYLHVYGRSELPFWGFNPEFDANGSAICRAQFKLREVGIRTKIFDDFLPKLKPLESKFQLPSNALPTSTNSRIPSDVLPLIALDAGASPGGWCASLIEDYGFQLAFGADPGKLNPDLSPAIVHKCMKVQDAVVELLDAGYRGTLAAYTCDVNMASKEVLQVFEPALELMRPGAVVVITLKNFDGSTKRWLQNMELAKQRFAYYCENIRIIHLFFNGHEEKTIVGTVKQDWKLPPP